MSEALAYQNPGTPQEISRRKFMANVSIGVGNIIGLVIAVPLLGSLLPTAGSSGETWTPLDEADFAKLQAATDTPVRITVNVKAQDAYLPASENEQFVWGIKVPPSKEADFKAKRPDLYGDNKAAHDVSGRQHGLHHLQPDLSAPRLPLLRVQAQSKFICPCHGSEYSNIGTHLAGPAPRGLDPLPLRETNGKAELTWIEYKQDTPDLVVAAHRVSV